MARTAFVQHYRDKNRRKLLMTVAFFIIAISAAIAALGVGLYHISPVDSYRVFFEHITGNITDVKGDHVIWDLRLPRALAAILMGAVLAIGGAIMQNATNNPLAEPYTMGVSSAALLGVAIYMALGIAIVPGLDYTYSVVINAFLFSLIPVTVILVISRFRKLTSVAIILIGIALMYLFSSISQYIMVTASAETLSDIYNWRIGSLGRMEKEWGNLALVAAITVPISIILLKCSRKLDIMYAGDRNAKTMGLNAGQFRVFIMVLVSLTTAVIVSFTGTIGFIGLVGPHVARVFVGSNNRYLLPCSAAFGAAFLVFADTIAKVSGAGGLPVGVISSMVGGPLFLYILVKHNKKVWN